MEEASDKDELLGRSVGKYSIVRLIGAGGMGKVYEGVHAAIGKRAALKFIDRQSATHEAVQRFQREAQAAGAIESAHIVEVFDVGETSDGRPYIVMELLRGEDLGHKIHRLGRLELPEALRIAAQVLRGLARAHEAGIVHRDLKPDNVFLVERDDDPAFVKILDFGVSKIQRRGGEAGSTITREGVVIGTPVYMSPEQAQALPDMDARTDLWSVGTILYECLTGRPPFSGATYEQVIVTICTKDADDVRLHNPEVPAGIAAVLKKAMARERDERFASARAMLDALVAESDGLLPSSFGSEGLRRTVVRPPDAVGPKTLAAVSTVAATPGTASGADSRSSSRTYLAIGAGAVAIGGIVAGVYFGQSEPERQVAGPAAITVVVSPTTQISAAPASATVDVAPAASAVPAVEVSAAPSVSAERRRPAAGASASARRPAEKPGGALGDGLELKTY
jgi:serine/threonine-protein kinase